MLAGIPIALRVTLGRKTFCKGSFHLGRFSTLINWAAVVVICFNTVSILLNKGADRLR